MKRSIIFLSLVVNIGLTLTLAYFLYQKQITPSLESSFQSSKAAKKPIQKRVAIVTPVSHPSLEQIEQGFINTLTEKGSIHYSFTTYNANGNRTLMRSQLEEIVGSSYDMIFTIATQPTKLAQEITDKKQKLIPIVFAATNDPVRLNIIKSMSSSGNNVTGVIEENDYKTELSLLFYLKPSTKNILLVYSPSESAVLERDRDTISGILKTMDINLKTVEIFHANEIYKKVSSSLAGIDVVMVLKDNTVVSGIDSLIKLCNQHGITLLASDLDSADKGAAVSFGVHEYSYGADAALKAMEILEQGKKPTDIPTTPVNAFHLKLNTKTLAQQGLKIDPRILFLMKSGVVL